MAGRRRSVVEAAYAPSPVDGLPNALSVVAHWSRPFGEPSSETSYFWRVITWWVKFGTPRQSDAIRRLIQQIPADRFPGDRVALSLPSGRSISVPAALTLFNPPDWDGQPAKAAHMLAYSTPYYDLFDLVFRDPDLVRGAILDFDAFAELIETQPQRPGLLPLLARYVAELLARRPAGVDISNIETDLRDWMRRRSLPPDAETEALVAWTIADAASRPAEATNNKAHPRAATHDIDVYGHFSLPIGIGEDARLTAKALEMAGYRVNRIDLKEPAELEEPASPIGYWAVPAPNFALRALGLTPRHDAQLRIIATPWELARTPAILEWVYRSMDVTCLYADFVARSLPEDIRRSAIKVPMAFDTAAIEAVGASARKAEVFTLVAMFDFGSYVRRKGPHRAIAAFKAAFPGNEAVRLIVKSTNGDTQADKFLELKALAAGDTRITFIDSRWESAAVWRLLAEAHVFVSLHSSEGFGRILAESMLLDTQVVATDYSGSTEVCRPDTALLVPYEIVPIGYGDYLFAEGQHWAEPDIAAAAAAMRDAFENWHTPRLAEMRRRGRALVREKFSLEAASAALRDVIERAKRVA